MLGLAVLALGVAGEIVGRAAGQVLDRLHAVLAKLDQHRRGDARHLAHRILDAQFLALGVKLSLDLRQIVPRPRLQLVRGILVEALDAGEFLGIDVGEFFDRGEALGGEQLARRPRRR